MSKFKKIRKVKRKQEEKSSIERFRYNPVSVFIYMAGVCGWADLAQGEKFGFVVPWIVYSLVSYAMTGLETSFYIERLNNFPSAHYHEPKYLKWLFRHYSFYDTRLPKAVTQCIYAHVILCVLYAFFMIGTMISFRSNILYCEELFRREVSAYGVISIFLMIFFYIKSRFQEL